jgi:hypothetical protein
MPFAAVHESGTGKYCCKSPKLPCDNFPAIGRSDQRPPICMASITLPGSPVSLSSGDEVPHIFTRKSRLQPGEFWITSAQRLLQQICQEPTLGYATRRPHPRARGELDGSQAQSTLQVIAEMAHRAPETRRPEVKVPSHHPGYGCLSWTLSWTGNSTAGKSAA